MTSLHVSRSIRMLFQKNDMNELTKAQNDAILYEGDKLQIVACAGSGKTEVLARRAVRLLEKGEEPSSIIAFTYTEKAARELKFRIESRAIEVNPDYEQMPPVARGMFIGTTHGWSFQELQKLGKDYELMEPLTEEQEWALLLRTARRLGVVDIYSRHKSKASNQIAAATAISDFIRNLEVVYNENIDEQILYTKVPDFFEVYKRYRDLLYDMRLIPFRSMIDFANRELKEKGELREMLKGQIRHVLVDEYQDFNRAQNELLKQFIEIGASVTVVGDDDQAIYQWRGGDVSLFTGFLSNYENAEQVKLERNHRSRPEIVNFAGSMAMEKLSDRLEKEYKAARASAGNSGVSIFWADSSEKEAKIIAGKIKQLVKKGHHPGDIAVLFRSVRTMATPLISELKRRGIPSTVIGKTSFLVYDEMLLIAHLFVFWSEGSYWYPSSFNREIVNRSLLMEQIRNATGVSEQTASEIMGRLERLGEQVKRDGISDIVRIFNNILAILGLPRTDEQEKRLGQMSGLLAQFDQAVRRAIPEYFYKLNGNVLNDETIEDLAINDNNEEAFSGKTTLGYTPGQIYLIRLKSYLEAFVSKAVEENPEDWQGGSDAVQIMTVHQSKGLEFPVVFVPSLVDGRFPVKKPKDPVWYLPETLFDHDRYDGRIEDEARLFYVALTRAKELAIISFYGDKDGISPFLKGEYFRGASRTMKSFETSYPEKLNIILSGEMLNLSFSDLVTFMECGYRYRLRHVYGFRSPKVPAMGYGKVLHHVIAELGRRVKKEKKIDPGQIRPILDSSFYLPYAGRAEKVKLKTAAQRRIHYYMDHFGDELLRIREPEYLFEVPIKEARIRGKIDLMLHENGNANNNVELIDFKTSETRPPSEFHANQLRLYATAAERLGLNPVSLSIHDLDEETGTRFPIPFDERHKADFKDQLGEWIEDIRAGTFEPTQNSSTCQKCDFKFFCPHSKSGEKQKKITSV